LTIVSAILAVVTTTVTTDSEPNAVVLCTTLGDGHDYRLMVGCGCHGAGTVDTIGQTGRKISAEQTLTISVVVDTLEEGKVLGVEGVAGVLVATHVLDSDMGVANDVTVLELLGCGIVGVVGVGEGSSLQVVDLYRELDSLVGSDRVTVLGACENGGDHLVGSRNFSHDCLELKYERQ
jgi:hypothetical protein